MGGEVVLVAYVVGRSVLTRLYSRNFNSSFLSCVYRIVSAVLQVYPSVFRGVPWCSER